ncbi:hypothetical protein [uncultured Brevibacillus sp.]|uniref:hypothetical protein n=1 Tax=uncultured Brevibacillus sp. TaxID=169970 RepID=UPI00259382FB|nr:hypothetical protein [uncultured Brevibacillus sp.]
MYYKIATILTPVLVEAIGEYCVKYDDIYSHSVWYGENCLIENITFATARDFCRVRLDLNGQIVFVHNTYFLSMRGQSFSKYIHEDRWHRRFHAPWIGFYPPPKKVDKETPMFKNLIKDFVEAEKTKQIRSVYKPFLTLKERNRYNRI